MERQHDERLAQLSESRLGARRTPVAEQRRILLVGSDDAWRLLTAYVFEEMGYTVYAAVNHRQAVDFTIRLLPDVVVVAIETPDTFEILVRLSAESTTRDIPIVVLTTALNSTGARRTRGAGGLTLLADAEKLDVLVAQVDKLIAAAPHARRTLKRRLLDLQELARFYTPDDDGHPRERPRQDEGRYASVTGLPRWRRRPNRSVDGPGIAARGQVPTWSGSGVVAPGGSSSVAGFRR